MSVQTRDYLDADARARALGCRVPTGIALLPGNFTTAEDAGDFRFNAATPQVRSAWHRVGLEDEGPLGASPKSEVESPKSMTGDEQVPLVVFFGTDFLAGPPWRLPVALGMVSSVLVSHTRRASPRDVRLDIVVERPGYCRYRCIEYQGDAVGIVALVRDVRRIWTGDEPKEVPVPSRSEC
jgi:hypothetical protein